LRFSKRMVSTIAIQKVSCWLPICFIQFTSLIVLFFRDQSKDHWSSNFVQHGPQSETKHWSRYFGERLGQWCKDCQRWGCPRL
jgi:hypothetical protein